MTCTVISIRKYYRPRGGGRPVGDVYLSQTEDGDGHTADLNEDRRVIFLYESTQRQCDV